MQSGAWERIGANSQILKVIKEGVELPITDCNPFRLPNYNLKSNKERLFLQEEIERLVKLGYIKKLDYTPKLISPIGCVPKKEGKFRLIHDLRHLNNYCVSTKFKQEDICTVEQIIQPNDQLTFVDLKDGFYHFKVSEKYQEYLSFEFNNSFYSFRVLCFGFCYPVFFLQVP